MTDPAFSVRRMMRPELDLAIDWAADEDWNPGVNDAACFWAADPGGFFVGLLGDLPVAAISVVSYGPAFGFLGLYLCAPEHRGRGYGLRTWRTALDLAPAATIGLDGVVAQQANYIRSGFVLAHRNIRYAGEVRAPPADDPGVRALAPGDLDAVRAMDSACFGCERSAFLNAWLDAPDHRALGCFTGDRLDGFAVVRPCRAGAKIGPLFAGSAEVAERLFDASAATVQGPLLLDAPETNAAARRLAEAKGLTATFETARMYRGPAPALPLDRVFGITTFELG